MFSELAISPSVFLGESYSHPDVCDVHVASLKEVLFSNALVRDLRDGSYSAHVIKQQNLHKRAKELITALKKKGRLITSKSVLATVPETALEWTEEGLASHSINNLSGILACSEIKAGYQDSLIVADVSKRTGSPWWKDVCRNSWVLPRTMESYRATLLPLLEHANYISIHDPHLDPTRSDYSLFGELLLPLKNRAEQPKLEIHRHCWKNFGEGKSPMEKAEMKTLFSGLSHFMSQHGLKATIFVWSDFHDRHILSDLGGIVASNGFDTSRSKDASVTWARIDLETRTTIARWFDPAANSAHFRHSFDIGVQ